MKHACLHPPTEMFGSQLPSEVPTRVILEQELDKLADKTYILHIQYFCTGWLAEHWPGGRQTLAQWPPDLLDLLLQPCARTHVQCSHTSVGLRASMCWTQRDNKAIFIAQISIFIAHFSIHMKLISVFISDILPNPQVLGSLSCL